VVELEENRNILKAFREQGIVVHILREKDAVLKYLRESTHFPPYIHETSAEAWSRREVYFRQVCSFEFVSLTVPIPPAPEGTIDSVTPDQTLALKPVERDFFRLLRFIHGVDTNKVSLPPRLPRSYSLSLTFRDVREAIPILDDISVGIDVWEFRVDLLESYDPTFIAYQVALLRQYSSLPIVLTIRTAGQGGRYPDPTDPASSHRLELLLYHALRLGVEYLDLELTLPRQLFIDLVAYKGNTSVIGSYHSWRGNLPWTGAEMRHIYDSIVHLGADVVKIVNIATTFQDNMALRQFAKSVERNPKPLLAINMGNEVGKISLHAVSVLNVFA
jgi:3-dehydroquinate dehydratase type I